MALGMIFGIMTRVTIQVVWVPKVDCGWSRAGAKHGSRLYRVFLSDRELQLRADGGSPEGSRLWHRSRFFQFCSTGPVPGFFADVEARPRTGMVSDTPASFAKVSFLCVGVSVRSLVFIFSSS